MRAFRLSAFAGLMLLVLASSVFAGGSNVYPNGAEGFWMGAAPPPGFYYVNYDLLYSSHKYADNNGSETKAGPLAPFTIDVFANVSRFIYVSDFQILGANWGSHVFIVLQDVSVHTGGGSSHVTGLGDTIVDPIILAWHWPNFHLTTGVDVYLPTGNYREGRIANLSANVFVYEPIIAFTYMTPVKGLTTSAKFMYDIPEENQNFTHPFLPASGDLQYGQEFHFDYSVDYMINPEWKVGLEGYFLKQTTADKLNGDDLDNGNSQVFAIGPGVEYSKGNIMLSWRTEFEMFARNRTSGVSNWLRLVYVFQPHKAPAEAPAEAAS